MKKEPLDFDAIRRDAQAARNHATPEELTFQPRTELGKELWELRQKIVASGEPLLDADEIDREVARRRGGESRAGTVQIWRSEP